MKRLLLAALVATVVFAKSASAFVFVPLLLAPPVITTGTGITLATWAAIAAGVGGLLYSVGLRDGDGNEFMRLRVNPNAPTEVPGGWSAANPPSNDPNPPASAGAPTTYYFLQGTGQSTNSYTTSSAACQAWVASINLCNPQVLTGPPASCSTIGTNGCCLYAATPSTCSVLAAGNISISTSVACPPGYTNNGGNCTLSNASSVRFPPNNRCGLKIAGGVMSYDSRDPDCDNPPAGMLSTDGKTLTITQGGQRVQVKINADNTVSVTQWSPTANGNTQIDTARAGDPASSGSSQIKSSSQSTTTATGDDAFAQSPSPQTPQFPDDYARDATVAAGNARLSDIDAKLDDIDTQLTTDGETPVDPTPKTQSDIESVFFQGTFDPLRGWTMPARAVVCPTWAFNIWGHGYVLDSHCGLIENQRAVVSAICLLVYGLIALFIVLGA